VRSSLGCIGGGIFSGCGEASMRNEVSAEE